MIASRRPVVVVTQGDPAGIGPELILHLAAEGIWGAGDVIVADPDRLEAVAAQIDTAWAHEGLVRVRPLVQGAAGLGQVDALREGVDLVLAEPGRALVTAPIDKAACRAEGFSYPGHTEYLAARAGDVEVAMLMAGPRLRVVLATVHVALREVPVVLTESAIRKVTRLLVHGLITQFGCPRPRIGVLGLNPHAGERGLIGQDEQRLIGPTVARLREELASKAEISGPLPADTAFHAHLEGAFDGLVAMYHDQGLAPFKLLHFHDGVNVTLGLPFVRTSPDHGTARDIAGRGIANPSSMRAAVRLARGEGW